MLDSIRKEVTRENSKALQCNYLVLDSAPSLLGSCRLQSPRLGGDHRRGSGVVQSRRLNDFKLSFSSRRRRTPSRPIGSQISSYFSFGLPLLAIRGALKREAVEEERDNEMHNRDGGRTGRPGCAANRTTQSAQRVRISPLSLSL